MALTGAARQARPFTGPVGIWATWEAGSKGAEQEGPGEGETPWPALAASAGDPERQSAVRGVWKERSAKKRRLKILPLQAV